MASTRLSVLIPTPRRAPHQRALLWAAAGISLAVLPWAGPLLAWLQQLPQWAPLARALAASPMAAWVLMLVVAAAVPLCALAMLWGKRTTGTTLGALVVALLWAVHMPAAQHCSTLYDLGGACRLLQAALLLLGSLALATGLFTLLVRVLRSLGWVAPPPSEADALNRNRYGT